MSNTRWSARADATKALTLSFAEIHQALTSFSHICDEAVVGKLQAEGLYQKMEQLEYAILTVVWNTILQRFNACSKALQSISIKLRTAVTLYESLLVVIRSVRDNFDEYEKLAIDFVNCVNGNASYRGETKRRKLRKSILMNRIMKMLQARPQ